MLPESERELDELDKRKAELCQEFIDLGKKFYYEKNYSKSIESLVSAQSMDSSNNSEISDLLGMSYSAKGQYDKALTYFEEALKANNPDIAKIKINIANLYFDQKEYNKSLKYLLEALDQEETYPSIILQNAGNICFLKENYEGALKLYFEALKHEEEQACKSEIYEFIGDAYDRMGDSDEAIEHYTLALISNGYQDKKYVNKINKKIKVLEDIEAEPASKRFRPDADVNKENKKLNPVDSAFASEGHAKEGACEVRCSGESSDKISDSQESLILFPDP